MLGFSRRLVNITPKIIRTSIPPTYIITCVAAIKSAYKKTYIAAMLNKVKSKDTAEWTRLGDVTTTRAERTINPEIAKNNIVPNSGICII